MDALKHDSITALIELSPDELLCVNNALNEVCHGLPIPGLPGRIGVPHDETLRLLEKVHAEGKRIWGDQVWNGSLAGDRGRIDLSHRDLLTIRNALSEALEELGCDEFETRMGVPFQYGQAKLRELDDLIQTMAES